MYSFHLKDLILGFLAAGISVVVFWVWKENVTVVISGSWQDYVRFALPLLGLVMAASFFAIAAMFIRSRLVSYGTIFLGVGLPYFFVPATNVAIGTLLFTLFLAALAVHRVRNDYRLSTEFSVMKIARSGLPLYFTIVSFVISIFYLSAIDEEKALAAFLPRSTLEFAVNALTGEGTLANIFGIPSFSLEASIDDILSDVVKKELESKGIPVAELQKQIPLLLAGQRLELEKQFGLKLAGGEKAVDVFYRGINQTIERLLGPYKAYLPFAAAAAFFFAFKALTIPFHYFSLLLTVVVVKIMAFARILKVETQEVKVDRLTL